MLEIRVVALPGSFSLSGELDMATGPELSDLLVTIPADPVTLDLRDVTFMDSSGIRVIANRARVAPVRLVNVPHRVMRVLEISGVCDLPGIVVFPDLHGD